DRLDLADDVLPRHRPLVLVTHVEPGIRRVVAVVPHHPIAVLRHRHRAERAVEGIPRGVRRLVEVRLVERLAVDQEVPLRGAAAHRLTTDGDHPLDQVVLVGGQDPDDPTDVLQRPEYRIVRTDGLVALVPGVRYLDHHDVALLRLSDPIADLFDEYPVACTADAPVQRGLHGLRRDLVDATYEGL